MYDLKERVLDALQPADSDGKLSKCVDILLMSLVLLNVAIVFLYTFTLPPTLIPHLQKIELVSVCVFTLEYLLRLWTADLLYPNITPFRARLRYIITPMAIIDLLSIIPFYLPVLFPVDLKALRTVRLIRLFQIFKLTRYANSLFSIMHVIQKKSGQLISSMAIVFLLIMVSSLLMYSVENPAQPEVFQNAFSGMWWAISTLTTIGYGDIYPITAMGKIISSVIALLGICLLAVPTAIISSGFIEQSNSRQNDHHHNDSTYCPHCGKKLR